LGVSVRGTGRAIDRSAQIGHGDRRVGPRLTARIVAGLTAFGVLAIVARPSAANVVAAVVTIAAMVPAAVVDLRERRLPNLLVAAAGCVFVATTCVGWATGAAVDVGSILVGSIVMTAPILLLHLAAPAAMGFGDVKAAIVLGAALGSVHWQLALAALTIAAGLGSLVGISTRARTIPFGPFLVVGSAVALIVGHLLPIGATP
jgi:leader peptidase (prepilin peptidase) / N-methyltransferase